MSTQQQLINIISALVSGLYLLTFEFPAAAERSLKIAAIVNDEIISDYDLYSRLDFVLFSSGLPNKQRVKDRIRYRILGDLVNEKLKLQKTKQLNIKISRKQISNAIASVEQRNKMKTGSMLSILKKKNIDPITYKRQLETMIAWQKFIGNKLASTGGIDKETINDQIDLIKSNKGKPEYLLAEIFISVEAGKSTRQPADLIIRLHQQIKSGAAFGQVARSFSESASAAREGNLGWIRGDQLDTNLVKYISKMNPGEISNPIKVPDGYYILMLHNKRIAQGINLGEALLSIRQINLPLNKYSTKSEVQAQLSLAQSVSDGAQSCRDMELLENEIGLTKTKMISNLKLSNLLPAVRGVTKKLKVGQASKPIKTKAGILVLMICSKKLDKDENRLRKKIAQYISQKRGELISRRELMNLRRSSFIEIRK